MVAATLLSRLPALHPYSTNAGLSTDKKNAFVFNLQNAPKAIDVLESKSEDALLHSLSTFVAHLVGCDVDEAVFKLRLGAGLPRIEGSDDYQNEASTQDLLSQPGIRFNLLAQKLHQSHSGNDDLIVTVYDDRNNDDSIQVETSNIGASSFDTQSKPNNRHSGTC
ncbi:hypothetical protein NDA16_000009 [Ustilago loliicola]|nr:hypothetical protein NDA16_000009 [Ustilago loliicola]